MKEKGLSLIEILIVVTIFAILGILTTRAVFLTLQGSKKSESLVKVRENLDYSVGVMERNLRNANSLIDCPPGGTVVNYADQNGNPASFSCILGVDSYVASGSARLTSSVVGITSCSFSCTPATNTNPASVIINIEAQDTTATGIQNSTVSTSTKVSLRDY